MLKNPDYFGSEVSAPGKDIIYPVTEGSGSLELVRVHKVLTLSHTLSLRMIPLKLAAGSLRIGCGGGTEQDLHVSRLSFLSVRELRLRRWVDGSLCKHDLSSSPQDPGKKPGIVFAVSVTSIL